MINVFILIEFDEVKFECILNEDGRLNVVREIRTTRFKFTRPILSEAEFIVDEHLNASSLKSTFESIFIYRDFELVKVFRMEEVFAKIFKEMYQNWGTTQLCYCTILH